MTLGRVESSIPSGTATVQIVATNQELPPRRQGGMLLCQNLCFSIARGGFAYRRENRTPQFIAIAWIQIERSLMEQLCLPRLRALH
jgi:hypothetical protein